MLLSRLGFFAPVPLNKAFPGFSPRINLRLSQENNGETAALLGILAGSARLSPRRPLSEQHCP